MMLLLDYFQTVSIEAIQTMQRHFLQTIYLYQHLLYLYGLEYNRICPVWLILYGQSLQILKVLKVGKEDTVTWLEILPIKTNIEVIVVIIC